MITRIEYQSEDGQRIAVITRQGECRWEVMREWISTRTGKAHTIGPIPFRTMTGAQSNARTWCREDAR